MSDGFDLEALRTLGDADRRLRQARRRLERASDLAAPQRTRVAKAKAELEQLALNTREAHKAIKSLELRVATLEGEHQKAQVALNQAKSNNEYQSLVSVIERKKAELEALETEVLEAYEAQGGREAQTKAGRERLATQEQELAEANQRVDAERAAAQVVVDECEAARAVAARGVPSEHMGLYESLLSRHGDALAEVIGEMCQGCGIKVRPEQISQVRGAQQLVLCGSCGRILWGRFG